MNRWILAALTVAELACGPGISQNPTGSSSSGSSGTNASTGSSGGSGGSSSGSAASLIGTWDLTTTPSGSQPVVSTVIIGQDQITLTSPSFSFTAVRSTNVLTFNDMEDPSANAVLNATQSEGSFSAGIIPFDLGGTWVIQEAENSQPANLVCNASVTSTEIDASCQILNPASLFFSFTTTKSITADSSFGDFGGSWTNHWTWGTGASPSVPADAGSYPCGMTFFGSGITTQSAAGAESLPDGGPSSLQTMGSPLTGITFTYDGANTISGSAGTWAEFSGTRR